MAKAPMMPVWTDALIADTTHLSAEQFGCYVLILLATWRNNGIALDDDDQKIARICRVSVTRFRRKIRPFLLSFFSLSESCWRQQRLEKEWGQVERLLKQKASAGALGGRARRLSETQAKRGEPRTIPKEKKDSLDGRLGPGAGFADAAGLRPPLKVVRPKSPARRIKIQLASKHWRYLLARGRPGEAEEYVAQINQKTGLPPQALFDAVDKRMRREHWDDMQEAAA